MRRGTAARAEGLEESIAPTKTGRQKEIRAQLPQSNSFCRISSTIFFFLVLWSLTDHIWVLSWSFEPVNYDFIVFVYIFAACWAIIILDSRSFELLSILTIACFAVESMRCKISPSHAFHRLDLPHFIFLPRHFNTISYPIQYSNLMKYFIFSIKTIRFQKKCLFQKLISLLNEMIDAYEQKHGPVEDRSEFDGEITVPIHLRNISLTNMKMNRLHSGLFGSLSRSRTLLTFANDSRHTYHGSVPNLNQITRNSSRLNGNNTIHGTSKLLSFINNSSASLDEPFHRNGNASKSNKTDIEIVGLPFFQKEQDKSLNDSDTAQVQPNRSNNTSYMALIQTNVHVQSKNHLNTSPNQCNGPMQSSVSDLVMPFSQPGKPVGTFQSSASPNGRFSGDLQLSEMTKFTLPRVSLSHPIRNPSPTAHPNAAIDVESTPFRQCWLIL